jgi:hypothetical protein
LSLVILFLAMYVAMKIAAVPSSVTGRHCNHRRGSDDPARRSAASLAPPIQIGSGSRARSPASPIPHTQAPLTSALNHHHHWLSQEAVH